MHYLNKETQTCGHGRLQYGSPERTLRLDAPQRFEVPSYCFLCYFLLRIESDRKKGKAAHPTAPGTSRGTMARATKRLARGVCLCRTASAHSSVRRFVEDFGKRGKGASPGGTQLLWFQRRNRRKRGRENRSRKARKSARFLGFGFGTKVESVGEIYTKRSREETVNRPDVPGTAQRQAAGLRFRNVESPSYGSYRYHCRKPEAPLSEPATIRSGARSRFSQWSVRGASRGGPRSL